MKNLSMQDILGKLIGGQKISSLISKIKEHVDHAGLLLPLLLIKLIKFNSVANLEISISVNNNLLIVLLLNHMLITDAMEAMLLELLNISRIMGKPLKKIILIRQLTKTAAIQLELIVFLVLLKSLVVTKSNRC